MSLKAGDVFYLSRPWRARGFAGPSVLLKADSECIVTAVVCADIESQHVVVDASSRCDGRALLLQVPRIFCVAPADRNLLWLLEAHRADRYLLYCTGI